ncbi:hypothetical protein BV20DRAFT_962000 [Pilatotrama ljubarskyi]|nr:hypothetical protein BV20DRAFT_962000 [Pilatotrama ljubarskyi]
MILLDGLDKHGDSQAPKLVAESSSAPVARPHTPTPSLPDYEASQAQLKPTTQSLPEIRRKRTRRRRCRKCALYALVVYFVVSVAIGVPLIVLKFKRKAQSKANPYGAWNSNAPIPPKSVTLGDAPLRLSSAKSCNAWTVKDSPDGHGLRSELDYHVPANGSIFLNTNITYSGNGTYLNHFSGQLLVGVNDDASASDATVHVTMHHSSSQLRDATNVCLMQTGQGGGLYLFTPMNLTVADTLAFNITLLLPRNNTSPSTRLIPQLLCHLPNFQQTYQQLDPYVTFESVLLGGAMSGVSIESIQASQVVVKASSAEIRGKFTVDSSLSLETVSAPINADVHLFNNGTSQAPTFMHLTTGNSVLNANVTMFIPPEMSDMPGPHFLTHAETFNAPLSAALIHDDASAAATIRMRAINNLGNTRVTVDSRYQGTFDVNTMFAQAEVLAHDGDEDNRVNDGNDVGSSALDRDDDNDDDDYDTDDYFARGKTLQYRSSSATTAPSPASTSLSPANASRCLDYDLISSSEIRGWVGPPPRPTPTAGVDTFKLFNSMGHIDVVSSLSGAQLVLLT